MWLAFLLIALGCFALSAARNAFGVSPSPDGGYPGGNTAEGQNALLSLTAGGYNTSVGYLSLASLTTGSFNTGVGAAALLANTGDENTATGAGALLSNTGYQNTANGSFALFLNTIGFYNTAIGGMALQNNTNGEENTANGAFALFYNTTGNYNTAIGSSALEHNITGESNTAIGAGAGASISGSGNVCIGAEMSGQAGQNDTTWIKNVYASVANGRAVYVNEDNSIGTLSSSRRYKDEIRSMAQASEAIFSLRPVTFRYKKEVDPTRSLSFGLIAEEVVQIDPDLVTTDRDGKPQTVRYEAVNAMLLNEFLKEHRRVEEQQATITQLKSTVAQQQKGSQSIAAQQQKEIQALTATLKEQASQIQKVSARVEAHGRVPQVVKNP